MKNIIIIIVYSLLGSISTLANPNCMESLSKNIVSSSKTEVANVIFSITEKQALDQLRTMDKHKKEFGKLLFEVNKFSGYSITELLDGLLHKSNLGLEDITDFEVYVLKLMVKKKLTKQFFEEVKGIDLESFVDMEAFEYEG